MSVPIAFFPEALAELREDVRWYEERQTGRGDELLQEVLTALRDAVPLAPPPEYKGLHGLLEGQRVRRHVLQRFPYILWLLETEGKPTLDVALMHQKRNPGYWLSRIGATWKLRRTRRRRR